jgi:hypothetical protein
MDLVSLSILAVSAVINVLLAYTVIHQARTITVLVTQKFWLIARIRQVSNGLKHGHWFTDDAIETLTHIQADNRLYTWPPKRMPKIYDR